MTAPYFLSVRCACCVLRFGFSLLLVFFGKRSLNHYSIKTTESAPCRVGLAREGVFSDDV